jgi:hypothetical protein
MREQGLAGGAVVRIHGDADAGRGMNVDGGDAHRRLQGVHDPRGELGGIVGIADGSADQHELIAAESRHGVGGAHHGREPARHLLKQFVARAVPQGIVDELEAVEIADQHRECARVAVGMRDGLLQSVVQQHAIGQARQRIMGGSDAAAVDSRPPVPACACGDHLFEAQHLLADQFVVFPFAAERRGALQDLDRFGGLAQHQQLVGVTESLHHLGPVVVGVRRTDDHLHVGSVAHSRSMVLRPSQPGGMRMSTNAMAYGRPSESAWLAIATPSLALMRGVDVEVRPRRGDGGVAEQIRFQHVERGLRGVFGLGAQDLAEVRMNGRVVVDDENAAIDQRRRVTHGRPLVSLQAAAE